MHMRTTALTVIVALVACSRPELARAGGPDRPGRWGPYTLDLVDEAGASLPTFRHRGHTFVLGARGQRYLVRVRNDSERRVEVVVSVDGRDVRDGRPADWEKRGYLVEPHGELRIDGYRLSEATVAAFRFSDVPRSYAARMGDARDVGVIGAAMFPERRPPEIAAPDVRHRGSVAPEASGTAPQGAPADATASAPRAAPGAPGRLLQEGEAARRRGLGTEFGEEHGSPVQWVAFERAAPRPDAVLTLRYDDRPGLLALGIDVDGRAAASGDAWLRRTADPFRRNPGFAEPPPGWSR